MTSVSISDYMNLGVAVGRAERKLQGLEAAVADYPRLRAEWAAGPKTRVCPGLVKSDVVFFGEKTAVGDGADLAGAELLIVMGTSLQVMPFASLIGRVPELCPRLLINRQLVGACDQDDPPMGFGNVGLRCTQPDNYRDVFFQSDCDAAVRRICAELGWEKELEAALARAQAIEPTAAWESLVAADDAARKVAEPVSEPEPVLEPEPEPEPESAAPRPSVHQLRQVDSVIAEAAAQVSHQLPLPFAMHAN